MRTLSQVRSPWPEILFRRCDPVKSVRSVLKRPRRPGFRLAPSRPGNSPARDCAGARNDQEPGASTRDNILAKSECRMHKQKMINHKGHEGARRTKEFTMQKSECRM